MDFLSEEEGIINQALKITGRELTKVNDLLSKVGEEMIKPIVKVEIVENRTNLKNPNQLVRVLSIHDYTR